VLRKQLMGFGIFREAGEKTLYAKLGTKAIAKLPEVHEFLSGNKDEFVKEYRRACSADWKRCAVNP
jgi:hypothetical protein